ncbi:hypothetical protein UY3_09587 [Chelonia mydas]|uniref:Uncharacterized protein n=1 Tax=Chelonia mydas TaxID=8469 RepID=M7BYT2_CHEMY|nr:hypothetical protein UY3_09587 [Chelonia mydas]
MNSLRQKVTASDQKRASTQRSDDVISPYDVSTTKRGDVMSSTPQSGVCHFRMFRRHVHKVRSPVRCRFETTFQPPVCRTKFSSGSTEGEEGKAVTDSAAAPVVLFSHKP